MTEAAQAAGLSRPTIFRAIKKGTLSARREPDNSYRIDASELARVFPLVSVKEGHVTPGNDTTRLETPETPAEASRVELAVLSLKVQMLEDQLARADRERETFQETVGDLRKRLDRAEERVLALSAPPAAQERPVEAPSVAPTRVAAQAIEGLPEPALGPLMLCQLPHR